MMEQKAGQIGRSDEPAASGDGAFAPAFSTVAIVDRSQLRRDCLKLAIARRSPQWSIEEFSSVDEVLRRSAKNFDLIVIAAATTEHVDLRRIEVLRDALPEAPLVVVAECGNQQRVCQILSTGARGFLPASLSLKVLMGAFDLVMAGGTYVPSAMIETAPEQANGTRRAGGDPLAHLTRRQRDVLALISQGKSNKLIGDALSMSENTVKAHVKQVIKRLHVMNRTQAALLAVGHGYWGV
jgi:DNA-binding NarL/FixJ family response regulator